MAKAINEIDAYDTLEEIKNLIIKTYQDKENIEPMYELRPRPSPLKIYTLLPKTNCKKCGEPTCLAFAVKLVSGEQDLYNCTFIFEPERKDKLKDLADIVKYIGYFLDVEV
ncbi:MAG: (Fe-S)-binding protein [Dehalobacterium sp.]